MTAQTRHVVFDMDGILIDSEEIWEESWAGYSSRHDHEWTPQDTAACQGMNPREWAGYIRRVTGRHDSAEEIERSITQAMIDALAAGRMPLLPGADRMVREAAAASHLAMASSAPRSLIEKVLTTHRLSDCFDVLVSSGEVEHGKPAPDVYLKAVAELGATPRRVIAVEDSNNGIKSAVSAGLRVIAVPNGAYPPEASTLRLAARITGERTEVPGLIDDVYGSAE